MAFCWRHWFHIQNFLELFLHVKPENYLTLIRRFRRPMARFQLLYSFWWRFKQIEIWISRHFKQQKHSNTSFSKIYETYFWKEESLIFNYDARKLECLCDKIYSKIFSLSKSMPLISWLWIFKGVNLRSITFFLFYFLPSQLICN